MSGVFQATGSRPARSREEGFGLDVIAAACRAPSTHNTQPWSWRVDGTTVELYAEPARRLVHADPDGRNLAISCGAALHHAQVAARGLGWRPTVVRWPRGPDTDLVARVDLEPCSRTADDLTLLRALHERRTDRRRFTAWPVQGARLDRLVDVARASGAEAVSLCDVVERVRLEHLVARAHAAQSADPALVAEHRAWTDRSATDGVPCEVVPPSDPDLPSRRTRFTGGTLPDRERDVDTTDGVVVLCGDSDDRASWVTTGEALGALWLRAVADGLSVVPLSQVIEVDETRSALQDDLLFGLAVPHLLLRVGWLPIGRDDLPPTPRRPLRDVLRR
ncbi:Acg family FMN-binding oxidoreductase [Nocardioides rubriscoriae]|uniref:Acg family FMN-binding oxidoreductase n=1 Tax=Nocardioides rubriscoriae TaxID=642762 RepID=UPI0011DF33BA|nr:NAD(P)H nitroreductase [Nocardioides rubriscoriae]